MQTNILWTGREYYSLENCLVKTGIAGAEISSVIVGKFKETIYKAEYEIRVNALWQTVLVDIRSRHGDIIQHFRMESDGEGNWTSQNMAAELFAGCLDVDIPLTPFTNTLPIKRLQLQPGESKTIGVIYFDLLEQVVRPVTQKYTCLSRTKYHYSNVPDDFDAEIETDEFGLVVDYPGLFVRSAAVSTKEE